jgi:membrane-bound metal-dependent hydrolase YbcI (DUF457 family)
MNRKAVLLAAVLLANAPDLDYIPGLLAGDAHAFHHAYTHTLGWVLIVTGAGWLMLYRRVPGWRVVLVIPLALLSHLAADLVTADGSAPFGIMALWPITGDFFISPVSFYHRLAKSTLSEVFQWYNVSVVLTELVRTAPIVALVVLFKGSGPHPPPDLTCPTPAQNSSGS